jgi:predicted aspartyl protease
VFLKAFSGKTPVEVLGDAAQTHTLPFKLVNEKVVVRARINGERARDLVLDTGAEETVISEETARRIGVRPITYTLSAGVGDVGLRGLQLGRLDTLELGTLTVKNVPVLIKNPGLGARIPKKETDSFSPLALGLSASIDYRNHVITMSRNVPQEPADFALPMRIQRLALVRGVLNKSQPAYFVVDTGGQVISISSSIADGLKMKPVRRIPLKVFGMSGWDRDAFLLPGVDLSFGTLNYTNMPLVVLNLRTPSALLGFEIGGIVGHKFLAPYRVTMDLARSELRLARN